MKKEYDLSYDNKKYKNLESIIKNNDFHHMKYEDLYKEYREYERKKQREINRIEWERRETELQKQIKGNSINVIIIELLKRFSEEEILELLDIKEIQQFLRKKKLEQLKGEKR